MPRFYLQPLGNGRWRFIVDGPNRFASKPYATEHRAGDALWDFVMSLVDSPACRGKYTFLEEHVTRVRTKARPLPQQVCL